MSDNTTFYIIRHGTTDLNAKMCFQGSLDIPLNEKGRKQSALLADYFKDIPIDLAVVSPLIRTRQTMEGVLVHHPQVPVITEPGLVEIDGGEMEGISFPECSIRWPEITDALQNHPGDFNCPGGERAEDVYHRVVEAVLRLVHENAGKTIVAVSHGFAIQTWLTYVAGVPVAEMREQTLDNVSVCKFTFDGEFNMTTNYIGDSSHLTDEMRQNYDWDALKEEAANTPVFLCYPKCSTCQKARRFLADHGVDYVMRHIVEENPSASEILSFMDRYPGEPKKFFNTSGMVYRNLGLKDKVKDMDRQAMADLLATDGMLVKRPQLIFSDKVLVGFKEADWAEALGLSHEI